MPLPVKTAPQPEPCDGSLWSLARGVLRSEQPGRYGAWIAALEAQERAGGRLVLRAPSAFHASYVATHLLPDLLAACRVVDAGIDEVLVLS
ncbi:hypothetical protein [Salipiger abyssi]|uniref:hypothetical protein n=1 Tax=Salipiger abyssi TaxID=1250539 RepID=UPI001A8FFDD4|nr:hypothetical protein [Salipiger abyssi]MBN9890332.1 hypothetical protein [Salipiger abyssi]